jgi:hypothetical protein
MRGHAAFRAVVVLVLAALVSAGLTPAPAGANSVLPPLAAAASPTAPADRYGALPVAFEANRGQTDERVAFLARSRGGTLFLADEAAVLALAPQAPERAGAALRLRSVGGAMTAPVGLDLLAGTVNYLVGADSAGWRTGVPTYGEVAYPAVYPGVDWVFHGGGGALEYDFRLAPGADAGAIRLAVEGADALEVDEGGDLLARVGDATLRQRKPVAYQEIEGERRPVAAAFALDAGTVGFALGAHDPALPLVIDPVLVYSTYLGGGGENARAIAVDAVGAVYVAGGTSSPDFPTTPGALQPTNRGSDEAFVAKLNPAGTALVYATYLGGTGLDSAAAIAVDAAGSAYVMGDTSAADFPTTPGALQPALRGDDDAFVAKLNPAGTALVYATFLGGTDQEQGRAIALDAAGAAWVAGTTLSTNFPTTPGALQRTYRGGITDAFVAKLNPAGSALVYATFLGGRSNDEASGVALDAAGAVYVAGITLSPDFPTTPGVLQPAPHGQDAFVAKLNPTGTALVYATFLGGAADDYAYAVAVDAAGSAYVPGWTRSPDFPTTLGAPQPTRRGGRFEGFVAKLNPAGTALVYSTYLGGSGEDGVNAIALDATGAAYVTGSTSSANFPTTPGAPQPTFGGTEDGFVAKLSPAGTALVYSTYLGGTGSEASSAIALDPTGAAWVAGQTRSADFPTTPGALQRTLRGFQNAFVAKLGAPSFAELCALSRQFSTNAPLAQAMCAVLDAAQTAERLGSAAGKVNALAGYGRLVEGALRTGALTAAQAAVLTAWAASL